VAKLFEGMREGDLEDMLLPLISVDEYESKIDKSAVVIGFYVGDQDAADDLNRFIQRSPVEILDTEISPAPDQQGYYMVFVELLNNDKLSKNILDLLKEIQPLTDIDNWQMHVRGEADLLPFSADAIKQHVPQSSHEKVEESILCFLTPSVLRDAVVNDGQVILEGDSGRFELSYVGIGPYQETMCEHGLNNAAVAFGLQDAARCSKLQSMLGEGWSVSRVGGYDVLHHLNSDKVLILS
jgi:hypothetical protein